MSQPQLYFSNPGKLDIRLITTFGANVKPQSQNPFGQFGTGLKYAIAGILRLGGNITIHTGRQQHKFVALEENIRGKLFHTVHIAGGDQNPGEFPPLACGFTTDLGRHWEPWMLYRELYSNALDEGGNVLGIINDRFPLGIGENVTVIIVDSPELLKVHSNRMEYFLQFTASKPIFSSHDIELYARPSKHVYYKGIRVHTLSKPSIYTYNLLSDVELTEDRTLQGSDYNIEYKLANLLRANCYDENVISKCLTAPDNSFESALRLNSGWTTPSELFLSTVQQLCQRELRNVNQSAVDLLMTHRSKDSPMPAALRLSPDDAALLTEAIALCRAAMVPITARVLVVQSLGTGVMGTVHNNTIYIAKATIIEGLNKLAGTLLEEQIHITTGYSDHTRALQNYLVDLAIALAQRIAQPRSLEATACAPAHLDDSIPF